MRGQIDAYWAHFLNNLRAELSTVKEAWTQFNDEHKALQIHSSTNDKANRCHLPVQAAWQIE